jgi:hypothetical protein
MFRDKDIQQLRERGIDLKEAERQVHYLRKGFPFMKLAKAASINNGIKHLSDEQLERFVRIFEKASDLQRIKFVPASGAATRMFKAMFEFDDSFRQSGFDPKILSKDAYKHVAECFSRLEDFAFYRELKETVSKNGDDIKRVMQERDYHKVLNALLDKDGMNYGSLPKGLLTFHRYEKSTRSAVEEHLVEGASYAANENGTVRIHLTVSPEHKNVFNELLKKVLADYEGTYHVRYGIEYSIQKLSTDTLALDDKQEPFREPDGSLHFRPGGHGALLENLNDIQADIIYIKNIDNVTHDRNKADTILFKKALGGMLIDFQRQVFSYLERLEDPSGVSEKLIADIRSFLKMELGMDISSKIPDQPEQAVKLLREKLNRPLRICGMVKNEGEPGGGPFWAFDREGNISLQIIESSQVDHHNPEQMAILNSATHFNPVDLVCAVKDYQGKKFDLLQYRDPDAGFISKKFKNGKALKAMELPGLWNGSMAYWNTVFVEVPVTTFTPVKTLHDLLRPEHQ